MQAVSLEMNKIHTREARIDAREEHLRHLEKLERIDRTNLNVSITTAVLFTIAFAASMILL